ncbi:hypothetical protein Tco_0882338 [Tanacetum coccineum]
MGVVMELHNGECFWPTTREVKEDDVVEEAAEGEAGNERARGSADMYRNMSQGDWQVIFDEKKLGSRKAYLLENKQVLSVGVFDEVSFYILFRALGWHLEEIHVTWAHLEKKWTRLRLYTISFEETVHTEREDSIMITKRCRQDFHIDGITDLVAASEHS